MTTDTVWTWTIIMAKGKFYHCKASISLKEVLEEFEMDGYQIVEIEAIIRH